MDVNAIRRSPPLALALLLAVWAATLCALSLAAQARSDRAQAAPRSFVLDLNTAPERHLLLLPGIGPLRARAIVAERDRGGPFASAGDLSRVRGIGPLTAAALAPFVRVSGTDGPTEGDP